MNSIQERLANELQIKLSQVNNVIQLLDDGNTVPFISRYRKEVTGGLSDEVLRKLNERLIYLRNLEERKADVIRLIQEQGKFTEEIGKSLEKAETLTDIEDIYRPFKPKKRTRSTIAQAKGLKPLAETIMSGKLNNDLKEEAFKYINAEKEVNTVEEAIQGALDIIAECISDEAKYRKYIRDLVIKEGNIES